MEVTRWPQCFKMTPMLLAVTPFPSPLTTPPDTSTYFMMAITQRQTMLLLLNAFQRLQTPSTGTWSLARRRGSNAANGNIGLHATDISSRSRDGRKSGDGLRPKDAHTPSDMRLLISLPSSPVLRCQSPSWACESSRHCRRAQAYTSQGRARHGQLVRAQSPLDRGLDTVTEGAVAVRADQLLSLQGPHQA